MGAVAGVRNAKGERRRAEIPAEAERAFAELGYRGAALNTIADRAGVTRSGLLHQFPSKEKLLFALLEEHFSQDKARFLDQKRGKPVWNKLNAVVSQCETQDLGPVFRHHDGRDGGPGPPCQRLPALVAATAGPPRSGE
ncbi:TetR/AcrR family transcriptional regulator [Paenarthrobacter sp. NPDC056912]|uniref:TetR/AcrR family transcriptional regulator n=1 Tax=Paenarthrobacter sp. NPDC056912 TaxID=3345965 RepID=UPI003671D3BA